MWRLGIVLTVATLCLLFVSSVVLAFDDLIEPDIKYSSSKDGGSLSNMSLVMHNDQYIDANSILMFVSNTGNFARDIDALLIQPLQLWQGGLIYPYTGIADILNGTNDNTLVYAAGIWIGAIDASDDTLVTVAEFSSEYIPGPMSGGTFMPDALSNDAYRVYKLHSDSTGVNSNTDYDEWPTSQGAPLDGSLNPLLLGNQTLWTVFNDADASLHDNEAGTTAPLGIEVRQLVWAADSAGQDNAVFLDYRLYNKGAKSLYDVYVSFWFDPDIGEPWDDLTGCDTTCDRFFAFNGDAWDREYGAVPGALAGKLIQGPVVPSSGDTAAYFNDTIIGYKNLGMTSFHKLINITEPSHSRESYRYMAGLDADGDPLANGTKYQYPGNPITMTGDIDTDARECRILVTTGPIPSFLPGDSQQVIIKLSASGQHNWVYSLAKALYSVDTACSVTYPIFEPPDSVRPWLDQHMDVYFEPKDDRWLTGVEWGESQFFNGGADFGYNFFGSYLDPQVDIDSFPTIEVRFSNAVIQKAYSYLRGGPTPWDYNGYHTVPFTVWDIDNDRQLNVAFSEWYDGDIFDSTWNPDATAVGNREYLFFFNSDYAGNNPLNSTIPYTTMNIMGDGQSLDVLYSLWPKVETGHTFSELAAGHKLIFNVEDLRADGPGDTIYFRDTKVGSLSTKILDVRQYSGYHSMLRLDLSATGIFDLGQSVVGFSGVGTDKMSIIFVPATTDSYFEYFTITDTLTETVWRTVYLSGKGTYGGPVWYVSNSGDDVNNDGSESSPFAHIQHAVDMAGLHDTVLVEDGAYSGVGNREINFFGKNLVLISRNGSGYVTIDCEGVVAGFKFENGEDSTSVVQGIAVISGDDLYGGGADINGSSPRFLECDFEGNQGEEGAGVSCRNGSNAKFVDCQFIANIAYYSGGGVFVENSAPVFDGCMFIINQANDGGGIYVSHSSPRFDNCVIHHNEANSEGGGIMCYRSSAIFSNCTITSNTFTVGEGEAVYIDKNVDSTVVIENSIIAFNEGDAVLCHGTQGTLDISCTDIYGNTGSDWSGCIEGLGSLNGNLSIDPMFCDTSGGDYSISSSSPCASWNNSCGVLIGGRSIGCVTDTTGFVVSGGAAVDLYYLQAADMDRNNRTDLVYTGNTATGLFIKYGQAGASFTSADLLLSINQASIVITYINSDEFLDIAAIEASQIHVLLNNGNRTFTTTSIPYGSPVSWGGKNYGSSLSAADPAVTAATGLLDGNVHYDMVIAPNIILYGDGIGGFGNETALGFAFETVNIGDFNYDGWDDLLITTGDSAKTYLNDQLGDFVRTAARFVGPANLDLPPKNAVVDFNYDGDLDYALVVPLDDGSGQSLITWVLGNGQGEYILADSIRVSGVAYDLVAADANKDHVLDIVVANGTTNQLEIYLGDGNGVFGGPVLVDMGTESDLTYVLASIDIDQDGNVDFVSGGLNEGNLVYAQSQSTGGPILADEMVTTGYSTVTVGVTNPNGYVISQNFSTVAGSEYWRHDVNDDNLLDEEAYDFNLLEGEYSITIAARAGVGEGETFSVGIRIDGTAQAHIFQDYTHTVAGKYWTPFSAAAEDSIVFYYTVEYPSSIQPANGAPTTNVQPTLDWSILAGDLWPTATNYNLQLDDDYYFGSPTYDEGMLASSSFTIPADLGEDAVYYWRVRALEGTWSEYSRTFALYIKSGCCIGIAGNANADGNEDINISDITYLVDYLFGIPLGPAPPCPEEGNANGDGGGDINISDITYLVDYLFGIPLGPAPPACP